MTIKTKNRLNNIAIIAGTLAVLGMSFGIVRIFI